MDQFDIKVKTLSLAVSHQALGDMVMEAAQPILDDARNTVERQSTRTGELARGLHMELQPPKSGKSHEAVVQIKPAKGTFYAKFVEFGTVHSRPEPFMGPAFDRNRMKVMQTIQQNLIKTIERIGGGERPGEVK
jgi:HK97 gp10 family phage protein